MENSLVKQLGERIRTLRKARGLSQDQLAEASGVNQKYVSEIERGRVNGSITIYDSIATGLGMTLSELTEDLRAGKSGDELLALFHRAVHLDEKRQTVVLETLRGVLKGLAE